MSDLKKNNYSALAEEIIEKVGGWDNIQSLTHCITRLRFVLKDENKAEDAVVSKIPGVMQVLHTGGQYQVVIGTHVTEVYKIIMEQKAGEKGGLTETDTVSSETKKKKTSVLDVLSSIFMPIMSAMAATGILKGLLIMLSTLGVMNPAGDVYTILYAGADAFFYFLPLALAITVSRKFECNQFVAFAVVAALLYPDLITAMGVEGGMHFLGLPVTNIPYSSSVIPAVFSVWVLSVLEKKLNKIVPKIVRGIFVPLICLVVMVPLTLLFIGPLMVWVGALIAQGYSFLYNLSPAIAGMLMAGLWPLMVIVGAHMASIPVVLQNMSTYGYDTLLPVTTGMNFAIAGAALAVALKTKNRELKELGFTTSFSALVGGVTEPAIYGIVLKYKKPFYICMGSAAVGGLVAGIAGSAFPTFLPTCLITLPAMATFQGGWGFLAAAGIGLVGGLAGTYFFGFNDNMIEK